MAFLLLSWVAESGISAHASVRHTSDWGDTSQAHSSAVAATDYLWPSGQDVRADGAANVVLVSITVLLFGALAVNVICHHRVLQKKNMAMARTIDRLIAYKDEAFRKEEENIALRENLSRLMQKTAKQTPTASEQTDVSRNDEEQDSGQITVGLDEHAVRLTSDDRLLYDRVNHEIVSRRLFLSPDFSKKELLKEIHIPANKFSLLFRQYAGCNFTQYVQCLRLDHAVCLMKEHPSWTLDAVARESQMSKSMFYDLFMKKYGLTPADYREKILS